jgi:hypothetical protein
MLEPLVACEVFCGGIRGLDGMCTYYTPPARGGVPLRHSGALPRVPAGGYAHPLPGMLKSYLVDKKGILWVTIRKLFFALPN